MKKEVARETVASHLPARTTLEQLGADTFAVAPSVPSRVSARGPVEQNSVRPVTARLEPGRVVHSFSDTTEPLAAPSAVRPVQMLSLSEFLASEPSRPADMALVQVTPPPAPIPEGAPIRGDGLQGGLFTSQVDTVFQPITQIQPYQNYSPTAAAEGKIRYDYICPQPSSVPADQRVSCPEMQELPQQGSVDRHFAMTQYCWVPTNLFHHPLYFEDVALERYGQQYPVGIQPFVSLGRFGIQFLGLPYQMALDPVHREIYPLGYYRPGDPAPELEYRIPFNAKAAATAAGVYTAFVFLIP